MILAKWSQICRLHNGILRLLAVGKLQQALRSSANMSGVSAGKVQVNGVDIHYDIAGTGKNAVLLLPGALGCAKTDFQYQLQYMNRDKFTIIAWDPRGYGRSIPPERDWPEHFFLRDAQDAAQLMKNLGYEKYSLAGWSDGGITALIVAARYAESVQKLVVWGANAYVTPEEAEFYETIRNVDGWSERMRASFLEVYGRDYLYQQFSAWVDAVTVYLTKRGGDICRSDVEKIRCPTLAIHGGKDTLVPRFHPEFLVKKIKGARLELFPAGKHNIHQRFYAEFNNIVESFLLTDSSRL